MAKREPLFQKPGLQSLRQAIDWVAFAGAWAILFNVLHTSGIEVKVRGIYEKAPSAKTETVTNSETSKTAYAGWNTPESKKHSKSSAQSTSKSSGPSSLAEWQAKFPHLSVVGAKKAWDDKSTVFLDARKHEDYIEGHIAGAINFYADDFETYASRVLPNLDPHKTHVIYCNGTNCDLSHHLAERLSEQGFTHVKVFFNGWSEWRKAGYATRGGDQP
jgi:rhodanese-related sulfurtransferase